MPSVCVYAGGDGEGCRISLRQWRDRKTGPAFPIAVLRCHTHGRAFSLYPVGHIPYGRVAVAPVSADGELLWSRTETGERRPAWEATLFAPAIELAEEQAPRPPAANPQAWWYTEAPEGLDPAATLLGLKGEVPDRVAEAIAAELDLPGLLLRGAARDYRRSRGPDGRAAVIARVLAEVRPDRCLVDRLLGAGALVGLWRPVERWDRGAAGARRRVFPGRGTAAG